MEDWRQFTEIGKYYSVREGRSMVVKFRKSEDEFLPIVTIPEFYQCDECIGTTIANMLNMNEVRLNLDI